MGGKNRESNQNVSGAGTQSENFFNISAPHILREIKFSTFWSLKILHYDHFIGSKFGFSVIVSFEKCKNSLKLNFRGADNVKMANF